MLIQLPAETWVEILDWLRRRDLVKKLDALWDRQFTPIVQDWLHKYTRNVSIGQLSARQDGLSIRSNNRRENVPIAEVDLPENIVSFKSIHISCHLDPAMLTFLHRMRPLFRSNICLNIWHDIGEVIEPEAEAKIRVLMPLISGGGGQQIEAIIAYGGTMRFLADNFHAALCNARVLCIWEYVREANRFLTKWLFTRRRERGQPRVLVFQCPHYFGGFFQKLLKRFLDPARQQLACPFFVRIDNNNAFRRSPLPIPSATENARTGELLTIRNVRQGCWLITNGCPPPIGGAEWLVRKEAEVLNWKEGSQQRTIFLLASADDDLEPNDDTPEDYYDYVEEEEDED